MRAAAGRDKLADRGHRDHAETVTIDTLMTVGGGDVAAVESVATKTAINLEITTEVVDAIEMIAGVTTTETLQTGAIEKVGEDVLDRVHLHQKSTISECVTVVNCKLQQARENASVLTLLRPGGEQSQLNVSALKLKSSKRPRRRRN